MPPEDRRRVGDLSDGEILARLDTITDRLDTITADIHQWRGEFVPTEVYKADERTRAEIRRQHDAKHAELEKKDDDLGEEITNLQAEATRRARERRNMWGAIAAAIVGAIVAGMFGYFNAHHSTVILCTPGNGQQVTCQ